MQVRFQIRPAGLHHKQYIFMHKNELAYCKMLPKIRHVNKLLNYPATFVDVYDLSMYIYLC